MEALLRTIPWLQLRHRWPLDALNHCGTNIKRMSRDTLQVAEIGEKSGQLSCTSLGRPPRIDLVNHAHGA